MSSCYHNSNIGLSPDIFNNHSKGPSLECSSSDSYYVSSEGESCMEREQKLIHTTLKMLMKDFTEKNANRFDLTNHKDKQFLYQFPVNIDYRSNFNTNEGN